MSDFESAEELAERLNLSFQNLEVLQRALTHRSYVNENPDALEDNERLEFLGDAVLDFMVGDWLYNRFPEMKEGQLTRMRSALVRTEKLAEFARQLNLGSAMRLGKGEREGGGSERPSLLCATFEAVVGALYLSAGMQDVVDFVAPLLQDAVAPNLDVFYDKDSKGMLQEWSQAQGYGAPVYQTLSASGPEHSPVFEVMVTVVSPDSESPVIAGRGAGRNKQQATSAAARNALEQLGW